MASAPCLPTTRCVVSATVPFYTAQRMSDILNSLRQIPTDPLAVVVELLLIGTALNWCVGVLHGTRGTRLFRGIVVVLIAATLGVRVLAVQMEWVRLALLYQYFIMGLGFMALVAFQPELRRAFIRVGDVRFGRRGTPQSKLIAALVESLGYLSRNKYGAVIAIQRGVGLRGWAENGTIINADVSANLLNTIFFPPSALHDLGVIIQGTRVLAANCQFPQAESDEVDPGLGSRHRAAVGLSYESDALVLVVSEETGTISLADNAVLHRFLSLEDVARELEQRLSGVKITSPSPGKQSRGLSGAWRFMRRVLLVVPLTLVVWYLADQASQLQAESIDVQISIRSPRSELQIDLLHPAGGLLKVSFRGSTRAINALRSETANAPLPVEWRAADYPPKEHMSISAIEILSAMDEIRSRGLIVESVIPDTFDIRVDTLESRNMRVEIDSGDLSVTDVKIVPNVVNVRMRQGDLDKLSADQLSIVVQLEERLRNAKADVRLDLEAITLPRKVGEFDASSLDPPTVDISLRIVGRQIQKVLDGIGVNYDINHTLTERYQVVLDDPNELQVRITVRGDKDVIDNIEPTDVKAFITITSDLAAPRQTSQNLEVWFHFPPGVTLDTAPKPTVRCRLVERASP